MDGNVPNLAGAVQRDSNVPDPAGAIQMDCYIIPNSTAAVWLVTFWILFAAI